MSDDEAWEEAERVEAAETREDLRDKIYERNK